MPSFPEKMAAAKAAKKAKAGETARPATAQGVGDSRRFGGNYAPPLQAGEVDWSALTVNGKPIPSHLYGLIPLHHTDQMVEAREASRDPNAPIIEFGLGPEDKAAARMRDGLLGGIPLGEGPMASESAEPWEGGIDPLGEMKKRHEEPGFRYRFLSERKIENDGWRGWNPVKTVKNGIATMAKMGNMILCNMSEDRAKKRDQFFRDKAETAMVKNQEQQAATLEQARRDGVLRISDKQLDKIARRRGQEGEDTGFQSVRGDAREMDDVDFEPIVGAQ